MATLKSLRYNLIDIIMRTVDTQKLDDAYTTLTKGAKPPTASLEAKSEGKPRTIELQHGVTLNSIRKGQEIVPVTFEEIINTGKNEKWDQSLEELLQSID